MKGDKEDSELLAACCWIMSNSAPFIARKQNLQIFEALDEWKCLFCMPLVVSKSVKEPLIDQPNDPATAGNGWWNDVFKHHAIAKKNSFWGASLAQSEVHVLNTTKLSARY